jgi:tRNASer (uridine44-2'-O)-methyltransferase
LLTHILVYEGYNACAIDPTCPELIVDNKIINTEDGFLIGNHADELTPWLPILSRLWKSGGYLSIPCCSWAWDSKWGRGYTDVSFDDENSCDGNGPQNGTTDLARIGLDDGRSGSTSTYAQYRAWVAGLSVKCGWVLECDVLRIPSTRNWAIIGTASV